MDHAHRRDAWLAWHIAAMVRMKRMPTFGKLTGVGGAKVLEGDELERRRQERDEMLERVDVDRLNEAMRKRHRQD